MSSSERERHPEGAEAGTSLASLPETIEALDPTYVLPAREQGRVQVLTYSSYDTFFWGNPGHRLQKRALVYLPFGYDPKGAYDVLYLMHGGWSDGRTWLLGGPGPTRAPFGGVPPRWFKDALDHLIEERRCRPLIVVCPTCCNRSKCDSADFSLASQLVGLWHREFVQCLMPAVESRYAAYARTGFESDLRASRNHRAFAGFSMGSVACWHIFEHCLDFVRWFLPMSGNRGGGVGWARRAVEANGMGKEDFTILATTGTDDFAAYAFASEVAMLAERWPEQFKLGTNVFFRYGVGRTHEMGAAFEYVISNLAWIFPAQKE